MTHDAEELAAFLAAHSAKGPTTIAAGAVSTSGAPHVLVNVGKLQAALLARAPEVTIPLDDGLSLTLQRLPGGGMVTLKGTF